MIDVTFTGTWYLLLSLLCLFPATPRILPLLQDVTIHAGERLELTCNVSADPVAQILWTKDNSQPPPRATLDNNNFTLIIESVIFDDDGRYTCVATNRQGNASSSATVEVQGVCHFHVIVFVFSV